MSEDKGFPALKPPGTLPKITSIFDFSAEALGELMTYIAQNPPPIPISQVIGFSQGLQLLDRSAVTVDVANSLTETSIYSFNVPGGQMSTNKVVRVRIIGDFLHNNVAGDTVTLRVKFGGTTLFGDASSLGGTLNTNRQPWWLDVLIGNLGVTNSQFVMVVGLSGVTAVGPTSTGVGIGGFDETQSLATTGAVAGTASIDTSSSQVLDVTVQWSAASANNSWRKRAAFLELL